jgi:hypothetical protein
MGAKFKSKTHLLDMVFWFLVLFFTRLAAKFEKSTNMTYKKNLKNQKRYKKCRISCWFQIHLKNAPKKSYKQNKFDEHE